MQTQPQSWRLTSTYISGPKICSVSSCVEYLYKSAATEERFNFLPCCLSCHYSAVVLKRSMSVALLTSGIVWILSNAWHTHTHRVTHLCLVTKRLTQTCWCVICFGICDCLLASSVSRLWLLSDFLPQSRPVGVANTTVSFLFFLLFLS